MYIFYIFFNLFCNHEYCCHFVSICIERQLFDIRHSDNLSEALTYEHAVSLCQQYGSSLASVQLLQETETICQKSCICGWIDLKLIILLQEIHVPAN